MTSPTDKPQPERDKTDASLRSERKNTDRAMAVRRTENEAADALVEHAREHADAVVESARDKADHRAEVVAPFVPGPQLQRDRALEDQALEAERAAADESLRRAREEQRRIIASLLPLEREKTDRFLLTERARSDDALAQRDDFLGMVTHDLRNLLSGVVLEASMLSMQAAATQEGALAVASAKRIERYVARMNRLIGDLVDVVSIDGGKLAIQPERCDATALLTEAVGTFQQGAAANGIALTAEAAPNVTAEFDRERMLQVLANLISNALKFTARGGAITVAAVAENAELRISVKDTGAGIPSGMLEAIFERFWQVGKNDKRGLGLGLYISRCIVEAHAGRIWAESTVGVGTTLHVAIPSTASSAPK